VWFVGGYIGTMNEQPDGLSSSEPLQKRWHSAFDNFFGFVEEAVDMAYLVRRSVNNAESLDEAVQKSLDAAFPAAVLKSTREGLSRIVRHGFELSKSISEEVAVDATELADSLSGEISEMVDEEFSSLKASGRKLLVMPRVEMAISGVHRRIGGPRLYAGLMLQLDSAFEVFIGELIVSTCLLHPIDYDLKNLGVTSRDISRAASEEGVNELFAEREAASVLARNLESWIEWFIRPPRKLVALEALPPLDGVRKFHLIRNVLAHGNGKPQRRHEMQMKSLGLTERDFLLSEKHFQDACREYVSLAYQLWATCGDKLFAKHGFAQPLTAVQVRLLKSQYVHALANLNHRSLLSSSSDEVLVNWWLAEIRAWDWRDGETTVRSKEEVRKDVAEWQPSPRSDGHGEILGIAKHLLLGEKKDAFNVAKHMVNEGRLNSFQVQDWPLFQELDVEALLLSDE
jgi:hypothetical protein